MSGRIGTGSTNFLRFSGGCPELELDLELEWGLLLLPLDFFSLDDEDDEWDDDDDDSGSGGATGAEGREDDEEEWADRL